MTAFLTILLILITFVGIAPFFLISRGKDESVNSSLRVLYIISMVTTLTVAALTSVTSTNAAFWIYTFYYLLYAFVIFAFFRFSYVFCTDRHRPVYTSPALYGTIILSCLLIYNLYSRDLFMIRINQFFGNSLAFSIHQESFFRYYLFLMLESIISMLYLIASLKKAAPLYRTRYILILVVCIFHLFLEYLGFRLNLPAAFRTVFLMPECMVLVYVCAFYSRNSLTVSVLRYAVDNQADGLMIYDENNSLIYTNNQIHEIFPDSQLAELSNIENMLDWCRQLEEVGGVNLKKITIHGEDKYFNVYKHKFEEKNAYIGMSFSFQDVTESFKRLEIMEQANADLAQAAHMKSDFLANMSHEIRTPMNAVIGLAEMSLREEMTDQARDYISQIKSSGRGLLNIINDILDFSKIESGKMDIIPEPYEPFSEFNDVANTLVNRIGEKDLELTIEENPNIPCRLEGDVLRIRQILINLANNAIKFTQKGRVQIICDYEPVSSEDIILKFHVVDTGMGIKPEDLKKLFVSFQQVDSKRNRSIEGTGLGLAISKSLVEAMGGTIGVESEYGKGSDFYFSIPQKIVDPIPSVSVDDPEGCFAFGMFSRKYLARRFFIDSTRMSVFSAVLRFPADFDTSYKLYEDLISDKRTFLFFEESDYDDAVREILDTHLDMTGIMITEFTSATKPDRSNLRVIHKPFSTASIAMAFNSQELRFNSDESQAFISDFTAPGAEILIVDDNPVNLTVAEGLLEPLKMNITCATSGKECLELIQMKHFDMVLMDHMMPELDGVETTRIIRRMHPELENMPIIALTANAVGGAKDFFLREGMNDFVPKPIEIRDIMVKVRKWLPDEMVQRGTTVETVNETDMPVSDMVYIPGLDCETAISMVGTPALYMKILREYFKNIQVNYDQLREAYANEDWEGYTIKVHALKSASRQIGAMELSAKAEALENAGKAGDHEFIRVNSKACLDEYIGMLDLLRDYCETEEDRAPKEKMETAMLRDIMERAVTASDDLDMDAMEAIVEELVRYTQDDSVSEAVAEFIESAELMDVFTCKEIAEKILDM